MNHVRIKFDGCSMRAFNMGFKTGVLVGFLEGKWGANQEVIMMLFYIQGGGFSDLVRLSMAIVRCLYKIIVIYSIRIRYVV